MRENLPVQSPAWQALHCHHPWPVMGRSNLCFVYPGLRGDLTSCRESLNVKVVLIGLRLMEARLFGAMQAAVVMCLMSDIALVVVLAAWHVVNF